MQISGSVERVKFRNEENGYTVALVYTDIQPYIVVGCFPPVQEGTFVTIEGEIVNNPKFGMQIKADSVKIELPNSEYAIKRFLMSGVIKGIGPKKAEAIVQRFGQKALEVLESWPERLATISGISIRQAKNISADFNRVKLAADAVSFLVQGMSSVMAFRVFEVYGVDTVAVVSSNPYKMIEDVDGIGFKTADKLAISIGIKKDSIYRIKAGIQHVMVEYCDKTGNTVCFKEDIIKETLALLDLEDEQLISMAIDSLTLERKIKGIMCEEQEGLMHSSLYSAEKMAATILCQMLIDGQKEIVMDADKYINHFEQVNKVTFHDEQKKAIINSINNGVSVITGGPGTGKTTIIKCIIDMFGAMNKSFVLLAPTGRAAKRMSESTSHQAITIHRLLMHDGIAEEGLNADAIIVDEFSMVDVNLLYRLLSILTPSQKLIIVGDIDQLPSVGPGNVLADIIKSNLVPVVKLTHIYRQSNDSMIITAAHQINEGICPDLNVKSSDFFFIPTKSGLETADMIISLVTKRLTKYLSTTPDKIQVLCPLKNGEAGSISLNKRLRGAIIGQPKESISVNDDEYSIGDKVMHTVNNYDLEWTKDFTAGKGVFNGDIGSVIEVFPNSGELIVKYEDGRIVKYDVETRKQLTLAYAITVHKSQGSEYDAVVLPVFTGNPYILTRNLLYTAVTRAKKLVVIVGNEGTLRKMVSNNFIGKRYSMLSSFLQFTKNKYDKLYSPVL